MAPTTLTFSLTPEQYKAKLAEAIAGGCEHNELNENEGTMTEDKTTVSYSYFPPSSTLTVTIVKKPFLFKESFVEERIKEWFKT